jgi:hypothetical protein
MVSQRRSNPVLKVPVGFFVDAPTMRHSKILHLFNWDKKFFPVFRDLIREKFPGKDHEFLAYGCVDMEFGDDPSDTTIYQSLATKWLPVLVRISRARKVILHGLFSSHLLYLLVARPWLLKKCYWVIWGGDLYVHEAEQKTWRWRKNEVLRRAVIQRLGYLISGVPGDVSLARKWYGARGIYLDSFVYPSNVFTERVFPSVRNDSAMVLVGNSSDPSNNHLSIFNQLSKLPDKDFKIICPLSYGDSDYRKKVVAAGREIFGDRFMAIMDFLPREDYLQILSGVDIAIFGFRRQQAMGNIIALLGMSKMVVMNKDTAQARMLQDRGFRIFGLEEAWNQLGKPDDSLQVNARLAREVFSLESLLRGLRRVWDE